MATPAEPPLNPDMPDNGEPFSKGLQVLRGTVRPLVVLILLSALTAAFLKIVWSVTLPEAVTTGIVVGFSNLASGLIGMWFGARNK